MECSPTSKTALMFEVYQFENLSSRTATSNTALIYSFGGRLSPVNYRRGAARMVSIYALFK